MERRDHIIDVFMALIGERQFLEVTPRVIASEAGVTLAQLRAEFASRGHIIAAFAKRIDDVVLSGQYDDMADEPARERLFDVMMSRIEALKPYRLAMGELIAMSRRGSARAGVAWPPRGAGHRLVLCEGAACVRTGRRRRAAPHHGCAR